MKNKDAKKKTHRLFYILALNIGYMKCFLKLKWLLMNQKIINIYIFIDKN